MSRYVEDTMPERMNLTPIEDRLVDGILACEQIAVEYLKLLVDILYDSEVRAVIPDILYKRLFKAVTGETVTLTKSQAETMIDSATEIGSVGYDPARK